MQVRIDPGDFNDNDGNIIFPAPLIGKLYKDDNVVSVEGTDVVVKLDDVQSEILQEFSRLKGMPISVQ